MMNWLISPLLWTWGDVTNKSSIDSATPWNGTAQESVCVFLSRSWKKEGKERQKIPTVLQVVVFYNKLQDI